MRGYNKHMQTGQESSIRSETQYWEGVNGSVAPALLKRGELLHAENIRCEKIGLLSSRDGSTALGNNISGTEEYGLFYFPNSGSSNKFLYRVVTVGAATTIYYLNSSDVWTALTGEGTSLTAGMFSGVIAKGNLFLANYADQNRMVAGSNGTTVTDSTAAGGSLYNSPNASLIEFFKDRLYLGDFLNGSTREGTKVVRSSRPLGLCSLVDGDPDSPYTTINLTDTSYVYSVSSANVYDIYRGSSKVAVFTATSVTSTSMTGTIAFEAGFTTVLSADEIWVTSTYAGAKLFRWPKNSGESGSNEKEYGTFSIADSDGSTLTLLKTIGDRLIISNKSSMAAWDDSQLYSFDNGVGCVSKQGWVKSIGGLYFLGYNGIYVTDGSTPKLVSNKVERYITGATKTGKEAAVMLKKGRSIFCYLGTVTLYNDDGSTEKTLSKVTLEYNITSDLWFVHTGVSMKCAVTFRDSTDTDRAIIANDETATLVLEYLSGTTDNGTTIPIQVDFVTPPLSGKVEKYAQPVDIVIETFRGTGLTPYFSLDKSRWYQATKTTEKGISVIEVNGMGDDYDTPPRCRRLYVSLRKNIPQKTVIGAVIVNAVPSNLEETDKMYGR